MMKPSLTLQAADVFEADHPKPRASDYQDLSVWWEAANAWTAALDAKIEAAGLPSLRTVWMEQS